MATVRLFVQIDRRGARTVTLSLVPEPHRGRIGATGASSAEDMSRWNTFFLESRIRKILLEVPPRKSGHHFDRPFLTAYQIAICFAKRYPGDYAAIGKKIGGKAAGQDDSLAKYFANQLSRRIKSGALTDIEGRFLNLRHLRTLEFDFHGRCVKSSLGPSSELSMFRLVDD